MATRQVNGLSILAFEGAHLAFPLGEVVSVQRTTDVESEVDVPLALGSLIYAGRRWPVFGFSASYTLVQQPSPSSSYCVCLSADDGKTGLSLVCDTVNAISLENETGPQPLPTCMQREATPLRQLFKHQERLLPVSTTSALAAYLRTLMENHDG